VAILLSRPEPFRLLLAFYLGGLSVSLLAGFLILGAFEGGAHLLDSNSDSPGSSVSIYCGLLGLVVAWLLVSESGRARIVSWRTRHASTYHRHRVGDISAWTEGRLAGASVAVAFGVGMAINLPSPVYVLALGSIAGGDHSRGGQIALVLLFNAIMFLLVEVPLLGNRLRPEATGARVSSFAVWLNAHGLRVVGFIVAFFSASLLLQGILTVA
jgi:hypothetical protein